MINRPQVVVAASFQLAWLDVVRLLSERQWSMRNLVCFVTDPTAFDAGLHGQVTEFTRREALLGPKDVAYTVFPHRLYEKRGGATKLFEAYNRPGGLYERTRARPHAAWGTYFRRMTAYECRGQVVNQLGAIIDCSNCRDSTSTAAYTVTIPYPDRDGRRTRGAPCLSYLAVQLEGRAPRTLGLLAA